MKRVRQAGSVDVIDTMAKAVIDQFNNIFNSVRDLPKKIIPIFDSKFLQKVKEEVSKEVSKREQEKKPELKVFFTKDPELLNQYYELRHKAYNEENGWKDYNGAENEFDREGKIVVAVENNKVVGGIRIMFSDECDYLSNEIPGTDFNYKYIAHKYDKRENLIFSEISALVVEKNHRDSTVTAKLFDVLFKESKSHGCNYIFAVAIALVCRNDRRVLRQLGYDVEIVMNITWKQKELYNFARMFPMYCKLQ